MFKTIILNGEEIVLDFSKITANGDGVLISAAGTSLFCSLSIGNESDICFKDLSVNVLQRGERKRSKDGLILLSKMIDRVVRPVIRDDLSNSVKLTFYVLNNGRYSIEALAVLGASLLLNIAKIANSYFAFIKITDNSININDSESDKFRLLHGFSMEGSLVLDFENLSLLDASEKIIDSYNMSLILGSELFVRQKEIVNSCGFKVNYLYAFNNSENTNKTEAHDIANKMFDAIYNNEYKTLNKFDNILTKKNYYFNYLVEQEMKRVFARKFTNSIRKNVLFDFEDFKNGRVLTSCLGSKVVSILEYDNNPNDIYHGKKFNVQFYDGVCLNDFNRASRYELSQANFINKALGYFIDKAIVSKMFVCEVLVESGFGVPCAIKGVAKLLEKDVKCFAFGLNSEKNELFFVQNKYEKKVFSDAFCLIVGDNNVVSAMKIDCNRIFFDKTHLIKCLDFYFANVLDRQKMHFQAELNSKSNKLGQQNDGDDDCVFQDNLDDDNIELKENNLFTIFNIDVAKIGVVIGKQGQVIKKICRDFSVKIDIDQEGKVSIYSNDIKNNIMAMRYIIDLTVNKNNKE